MGDIVMDEHERVCSRLRRLEILFNVGCMGERMASHEQMDRSSKKSLDGQTIPAGRENDRALTG